MSMTDRAPYPSQNYCAELNTALQTQFWNALLFVSQLRGVERRRRLHFPKSLSFCAAAACREGGKEEGSGTHFFLSNIFTDSLFVVVPSLPPFLCSCYVDKESRFEITDHLKDGFSAMIAVQAERASCCTFSLLAA